MKIVWTLFFLLSFFWAAKINLASRIANWRGNHNKILKKCIYAECRDQFIHRYPTLRGYCIRELLTCANQPLEIKYHRRNFDVKSKRLPTESFQNSQFTYLAVTPQTLRNPKVKADIFLVWWPIQGRPKVFGALKSWGDHTNTDGPAVWFHIRQLHE